jgi:YesN/AraC family two-component response regulator
MTAAALINTLHRAGTDGAMNAKALYRDLTRCESASDFKREFLRIAAEIIGAGIEARSQKIDKLKGDFEAYIEKNLSRNISLLDMSEHFNLSPNYTSNLFKCALGENFKDYLTRKRFEAAAAILRREPQIKLADLAERVGITSVNTLIRVFHKYGGTSPGQFIKGA